MPSRGASAAGRLPVRGCLRSDSCVGERVFGRVDSGVEVNGRIRFDRGVGRRCGVGYACVQVETNATPYVLPGYDSTGG